MSSIDVATETMLLRKVANLSAYRDGTCMRLRIFALARGILFAPMLSRLENQSVCLAPRMGPIAW